MKKLITLMVLCLFLSKGFAGTIDPEIPDQKYIEYGSKFDSVVKICCFDGKGLSCGSAVVIDAEWIITAAHVVEGSQNCTIIMNKKKYNIDKIIIHKNYKTHTFGYDDIALGHIEEKIDLKYYPKIYQNSDEVGKICSISGWGFTGNFITGTKIHDDNRRAGSNFIDRIEKNVLICSPSKRKDKFTELEFLICSGDSGGGLFIDNKLAGINSSVIGYDGKSDSTYGDESCHTRLSLYYNWIKEEMEK
jgi:secreted trypsin-like serine protease